MSFPRWCSREPPCRQLVKNRVVGRLHPVSAPVFRGPSKPQTLRPFPSGLFVWIGVDGCGCVWVGEDGMWELLVSLGRRMGKPRQGNGAGHGLW